MIATVTYLFLFANFVFCAPTINTTNGDVAPCLEEFYKSAFSGKYKCTKDFNFFSDNTTLQQGSFKSGKTCFLEIAKEKCSPAQYTLLVTKYDDFLSVLTTVPQNDPECKSFYYKYNSLRCAPIAQEVPQRAMQLAFVETKINDSRLIDVITLCREAEKCMNTSCSIPNAAKNGFSFTCDALEMKNTEFAICSAKLKKEAPSLSEYKCLDGMNFYAFMDVNVQADLWTIKKACVKEIYKDYCGKAAVKDFDHNAGIMAKSMQMMTQMG